MIKQQKMAKIESLITAVGLFFCTIFPQHATMAQDVCVEKGKRILSLGYGIPNQENYGFSNDFINGTREWSGLGPVFLKGEYMLTNRFGLGVNYSVRSFQYTDRYLSGAEFRWKENDMRVMIQGAWHAVVTRNWDVYLSAGAGVSYYQTSRNGVYMNSLDQIISVTNQRDNIFKEAALIGAGVRYFPIRAFGIYAETGLDQGASIQAGFLMKF